ncbi:MAG: cyclase family protein [Thermomicrobiales bacterium]|nr:cyclase family protein [Thermomicrobiales bacterium]
MQTSSTHIVDLSHHLDTNIPMFPGLPAPESEEFVSREASRAHYAGDTTFLIQRFRLIGNSGTYMDTPFHRYADGDDLASLSLVHLVDLPGVVVDATTLVAAGRMHVDADDLADVPVEGRAVLIRTGWDAHWAGPDYLGANPHLTDAAGRLLVERGAVLVGIDSWNVDDTTDGHRPVHSRLLRAGIPIVENLCNINQLPTSGFRFHAAPLAIVGGSAMSVRAYAVVQDDAFVGGATSSPSGSLVPMARTNVS